MAFHTSEAYPFSLGLSSRYELMLLLNGDIPFDWYYQKPSHREVKARSDVAAA